MAERGVTLGKDPPAASTSTGTAVTDGTADGAATSADIPTELRSNMTDDSSVTLNAKQLKNASIVIGVGESMKLPTRYIQTELMTILVEANALNLASEAVPESKNYPHDGVAKGDLVGINQQRTGWGSVKERRDPATSAKLFYKALLKVAGRDSMWLGRLAQAVQISAFPDRYATWELVAADILKAASVDRRRLI